MPDATHMLAALQPTKENLGSTDIGGCHSTVAPAAFWPSSTDGSRPRRFGVSGWADDVASVTKLGFLAAIAPLRMER
jgi:hypothetical protein